MLSAAVVRVNFSIKTYVVVLIRSTLTVALLMSTHNICFQREIRKLFTSYLLLCVYFYREQEKIIPELSLNAPPEQVVCPVFQQKLFIFFSENINLRGLHTAIYLTVSS